MFCAPVAAPKPAFLGVRRAGLSEPSALNCGLRTIRFDRVVERQRRAAVVDDRDVERVERVDAELELTAAAQADVAREGEVDRLVRAAAQEVAARLQARRCRRSAPVDRGRS